MQCLEDNQVHLWIVNFNEIGDHTLFHQYWALLSDDEKKQARQLTDISQQNQFLATRALVRTVLSKYADVAPNDWYFSTNYYGRPEIANNSPTEHALSFNISHTENHIALAVTRARALGIDVENLNTRPAPLRIVHRFFAKNEIEALNSLPMEDRHLRFFQYWTLKESYIKARGLGIAAVSLSRFGFNFISDEHIKIWIDSELNDDPERWVFWQLHASSECLASVCVERGQMNDQELITRRTIPLISDSPLECSMLCRTATAAN